MNSIFENQTSTPTDNSDKRIENMNSDTENHPTNDKHNDLIEPSMNPREGMEHDRTSGGEPTVASDQTIREATLVHTSSNQLETDDDGFQTIQRKKNKGIIQALPSFASNLPIALNTRRKERGIRGAPQSSSSSDK